MRAVDMLPLTSSCAKIYLSKSSGLAMLSFKTAGRNQLRLE